jgi:hypothetical protein
MYSTVNECKRGEAVVAVLRIYKYLTTEKYYIETEKD